VAALTVAADEEELARITAARLVVLVEQAIARHGNVMVSLTGGRTPERLYSLLADERHPWRARIDWPRVHLFWGDERHVPPEHADSNFGMAYRALVRHVPVPASQVHRMRGEWPDAREAARDYERELREGFAAAGRMDQTFDVMLLGLGEDAHIASIFPGSELLAGWRPVQGHPTDDDAGRGVTDDAGRGFMPRHERVAAIWAAHLNAWRITMTPAAVLDARAIVMVVAGASKAEAVRAARESSLDVDRWPAQILRGAADRVDWFVDRAAAPA
jgi:6-phosphogluconolactonase